MFPIGFLTLFYKVLLFFISLTIMGCGFRPLLRSPSELPGITLTVIADRQGQQLRTLLKQHFCEDNPLYRLTIQIKQLQTPIAVERTSLTSRYQLRLTASYRLSHLKNPERVITGSLDALGSFNMLKYTNYIQGSSEYSNLVSAESASERALKILSEELALQIYAILDNDPELKQPTLDNPHVPPEEILTVVQNDQGEPGFNIKRA